MSCYSSTGICRSDDYIHALIHLSKAVLAKTKIKPSDVIAIGTAFTNCTMMPIDKEGNVLCQRKEYRQNPHAWVKLWKHHAAEPYAEIIEEHALKKLPRIKNYGNSVSSEWLFPKILQILKEDYRLYLETDTFIEAADWIVFKLCNQLVRNSATLGVNAFWDTDEGGYPPHSFFKEIDDRWENVVEEKLKGEVKPVGQKAGNLTAEMAEAMGLTTDTIVAVGHGDSEVVACGAGVAESNTMILVMGTSTCHQMMHNNRIAFDGVSAIVKDGMVPGFYAYESGQPAVGDSYEWFVNNFMPLKYVDEAKELGISLLQLMDKKAEQLCIGESGLVSLDWLNGNRSILMDYSLTGGLIGLTLKTTPEEIYRCLVEATAFGTKVIFDTYTKNSVPIYKVIGTGGLSRKSSFVMQLYADVLGKKISVPQITNMSALGSAVCAAVAAGAKNGGYAGFSEAVNRMGPKIVTIYEPNMENHKAYNNLFEIYKELHNYFGTAADSPMRKLLALKNGLLNR